VYDPLVEFSCHVKPYGRASALDFSSKHNPKTVRPVKLETLADLTDIIKKIQPETGLVESWQSAGSRTTPASAVPEAQRDAPTPARPQRQRQHGEPEIDSVRMYNYGAFPSLAAGGSTFGSVLNAIHRVIFRGAPEAQIISSFTRF
jgi:hypothetical protein